MGSSYRRVYLNIRLRFERSGSMSIITIFLILLVVIFAAAAYFMEPSEAEKRTHERLAALHRPTGQEIEEGIVKEVVFSRISFINDILKRSNVAPKLHLMLEQANLPWTVNRFLFYSVDLMFAGA